MRNTTTHRLHQNQTICIKLSTTTARNIAMRQPYQIRTISMMTSARLSAPNLHFAPKSFNAATRDALVQGEKKENKKISLMVPIIETPSADTSNAMSNFPVPCFFYGTPSDPKYLAKELELAEHPDMPKACSRCGESTKLLWIVRPLNTICWRRVKHTRCRMKSSLESWLLWKAKTIRCRDVRYSVKGKGKGNGSKGSRQCLCILW